ncbi:MAG: hypothetical protein AAGK05_18385, partial [Pseudomonadota bacterium]
KSFCSTDNFMTYELARICNSSRFSSVSLLLEDLEWLSNAKRIEYRLAVLVFNCRQDLGLAWYLKNDVILVFALFCRFRLLSSSSTALAAPLIRSSTLGGRSFQASARWNSFPSNITNLQSSNLFKLKLKANF